MKVRTTTIVTAWLAVGAGCGTEEVGTVWSDTEVTTSTPPGTMAPTETSADTGQVPGTAASEPTGDSGR